MTLVSPQHLVAMALLLVTMTRQPSLVAGFLLAPCGSRQRGSAPSLPHQNAEMTRGQPLYGRFFEKRNIAADKNAEDKDDQDKDDEPFSSPEDVAKDIQWSYKLETKDHPLVTILLLGAIALTVLYEGLWKVFLYVLKFDFAFSSDWGILDQVPRGLIDTARALVGVSLALEALGLLVVVLALAYYVLTVDK